MPGLAHRLRAGGASSVRVSRHLQMVRASSKAVAHNDVPHKTYFSPPPPPPPPRLRRWRFVRGLLFGTACFCGGAVYVTYQVLGALHTQSPSPRLQQLPLTPESATLLLKKHAVTAYGTGTVTQHCSFPSNSPSEDTSSISSPDDGQDPRREWAAWAIYDGHAGPQTSMYLLDAADQTVLEALRSAGCARRPYTPNDPYVVEVIKSTFERIDRDILEKAGDMIAAGVLPRSEVIAAAWPAFSGSCALMAIFDPVHSVLRVANVGDSRAVLGRWDGETNKYVAYPMSHDHTGFNNDEVARMEREHPGEQVIDPHTGRTNGIAVTRAFGDSRWKWPEELSEQAHAKYWGPTPRPQGSIKTPPYLTAEPEVTETTIRKDAIHPDFLIMASDGLWDLVSSEDAVACVQMWLDQYDPTTSLLGPRSPAVDGKAAKQASLVSSLPVGPTESRDDQQYSDGAYWDEHHGALMWRVSPEHFVVEDDHCAVHLMRNALGGKRKELMASVMSVEPPLSRNMRDDITVHVIFFGVDGMRGMQNTHDGLREKDFASLTKLITSTKRGGA